MAEERILRLPMPVLPIEKPEGMFDMRTNALAAVARFGLNLSSGRRVTKRTADRHARMSEFWLNHAHGCGRPPYREGPGFCAEPGERIKVKGHEVPYGPTSRTFWKYVWLAMKSAFKSGVHDAMDSEYETREGNPRDMAIVKGITS